MTLYQLSEVGEACEITFFCFAKLEWFWRTEKVLLRACALNTMFTSSHALDFVDKTAKQLIHKTKSCKYTSIVVAFPLISGLLHSRNLAWL